MTTHRKKNYKVLKRGGKADRANILFKKDHLKCIKIKGTNKIITIANLRYKIV